MLDGVVVRSPLCVILPWRLQTCAEMHCPGGTAKIRAILYRKLCISKVTLSVLLDRIRIDLREQVVSRASRSHTMPSEQSLMKLDLSSYLMNSLLMPFSLTFEITDTRVISLFQFPQLFFSLQWSISVSCLSACTHFNFTYLTDSLIIVLSAKILKNFNFGLAYCLTSLDYRFTTIAT